GPAPTMAMTDMGISPYWTQMGGEGVYERLRALAAVRSELDQDDFVGVVGQRRRPGLAVGSAASGVQTCGPGGGRRERGERSRPRAGRNDPDGGVVASTSVVDPRLTGVSDVDEPCAFRPEGGCDDHALFRRLVHSFDDGSSRQSGSPAGVLDHQVPL